MAVSGAIDKWQSSSMTMLEDGRGVEASRSEAGGLYAAQDVFSKFVSPDSRKLHKFDLSLPPQLCSCQQIFELASAFDISIFPSNSGVSTSELKGVR